MDSDLATQMVMLSAASTQNSMQIAMIKQQHEMDMSLIAVLADAAKAPPPEGQGLLVDKTA